VGECFFQYRPTLVVPDKGSLSDRVCVCIYRLVLACVMLCISAALLGSFSHCYYVLLYYVLLAVEMCSFCCLMFIIFTCYFSHQLSYNLDELLALCYLTSANSFSTQQPISVVLPTLSRYHVFRFSVILCKNKDFITS